MVICQLLNSKKDMYNLIKNRNNVNMFFKKIIVLVAFLFTGYISAQQDPNFTLYNFNMIVINPAYAGSQGAKEINLSHRSQWVGIDNAPSTQSFSFSTPTKGNIGVGFSIVSDKVFILSQTDLGIDISYKLKVSENHDLFFGMKGGGGFVNIDLNNAGAMNTDGLFSANQSFFNAHIGAGLYLRHEKYYLTVSTPNFLKGSRYEKKGNMPSAAIDNSHFYLGGGYIFDIGENYKLSPALMMRTVAGAPNSYDISSRLDMHNLIGFGANYRVDEMVSLFSLLNLTKKVIVGFVYDYSTSGVSDVGADNSIEFLLKYRF
jgi:type IX secretion system PorP/SprF family membrane protein